MNEITERTARNLRSAREEAGLSRADLAEKMDCHPNALYLWETGKREIGHEALCSAASILGRSWLWFYQGQEAEKEAVQIPPAAAPALSEAHLREKFESWLTELKASGGDGGRLSTCPPATDEEKSVILAALAARDRLLEERQRKAG